MTETLETQLPQYMRGNCHLLLPENAPIAEWRKVRRGGLGASVTVGVSCGDNADSLFIARSIATAVAHTLARF